MHNYVYIPGILYFVQNLDQNITQLHGHRSLTLLFVKICLPLMQKTPPVAPQPKIKEQPPPVVNVLQHQLYTGIMYILYLYSTTLREPYASHLPIHVQPELFSHILCYSACQEFLIPGLHIIRNS